MHSPVFPVRQLVAGIALPLALLTFFATFIPLIGAPIALFVATLVALAARGPLNPPGARGPPVTQRPSSCPG